MPSGSYLAVSHLTEDGVPNALIDKLAEFKQLYNTRSSPLVSRSQAEIGALLGDFELLEPGLTWTPLWHPEEADTRAPKAEFDTPNESVMAAAVGKKR